MRHIILNACLGASESIGHVFAYDRGTDKYCLDIAICEPGALDLSLGIAITGTLDQLQRLSDGIASAVQARVDERGG